MTQWYYMQDGQSVGPVSYDRMKQLVDAGVLTPDSAVRYEGGEWQEVAEVSGLKTVESITSHQKDRSQPSGSGMKYMLATVCLMVAVAAVWFGGTFAWNQLSGGDASAQSALEDQLDTWVAGNSGADFAKSPLEVGTVLLDYEIKIFVPDKDHAMVSDAEDSYRATVNLTFLSEAGTDIKKQHQWMVYRNSKGAPWRFWYVFVR